jgi:hypothetical protein
MSAVADTKAGQNSLNFVMAGGDNIQVAQAESVAAIGNDVTQ